MTGKSKARFVSKKIITFDQMRDNVQGYVIDVTEAAFAANFPIAGFFGAGPAVARVSSSVISVGAAGGPFLGTDGKGHLLSFANTVFPSVQLPSGLADGTVVNFGLERALLDQGVEINPRTQKVNYRKQTEAIGRAGTPDLVVDNGDGTLTFTVDSVTEAGVNYAGRTVTVWLKALEDGGTVGPQSAVEGIAIETRTIAFGSGHNKITTVGKLGQGVAPSTSGGDYIIVLNGPTVMKQTTQNLTATPGVLFLGTSTAAGGDAALSIVTSGQRQLVSEGELLSILKRGLHGGLKIHVVSDALDDGVNQIEVISPLGEAVFTVDELGRYDGTASGRWSGLDEEWSYGDAAHMQLKWQMDGAATPFSGGAAPGFGDPVAASYAAPFLTMTPHSSPNAPLYWTTKRSLVALKSNIELELEWEWSVSNLSTVGVDWNSIGVGLAGGTIDIAANITDCIWIKADLTSTAGTIVCETRAGAVVNTTVTGTAIPVGAVPSQKCRIRIFGSATPAGIAAGGFTLVKFYVDGVLRMTATSQIPAVALRPYLFMTMTNGVVRTMNVGPIKGTFTRY